MIGSAHTDAHPPGASETKILAHYPYSFDICCFGALEICSGVLEMKVLSEGYAEFGGQITVLFFTASYIGGWGDGEG